MNKYKSANGADEQFEEGISMLPFRKTCQSAKVTPQVKVMARLMALDRVQPGTKMEQQGRASSAPCQLCGYTTDDYYHRIVECQHEDVIKAREQLPRKWLQEATKMRKKTYSRQVAML